MKNSSKILSVMYKKMLIQQIISSIVISLNSIIDTFMIGRYIDNQGLSAMGFYGPITNVIFLCCVFSLGTQILVSEYIGKGDSSKARSIFSTCTAFLTIGFIVFGFLVFFFAEPLAGILGANGTCKEMLVSYLHGVAPGYVFLALYNLFVRFLQLNNKDSLARVSIAVMIVSNVSLDYIFVKAFDLGMFGMGLATAISNMLAMVVCLSCYLSRKNGKTLYFEFSGINFKNVGAMIPLGSSEFTFNVIIALRTYIFNIIILKICGPDAVAVMTILYTVCSFIGTIPSAATNSAITLGSIFYGERNTDEMKELYRYTIRNVLIVTTIVAGLIMVFRRHVAFVFAVPGTPIFDMTVDMLLLFPSMIILNGILHVTMGMYQCQKKMFFQNFMNIFENLSIPFVALGLSVFMGANGIWSSFTVAQVFCLLIIVIRVLIKKKKLSFKLTDWLDFDRELLEESENSLLINASNMDEVVEVSKKIQEFLGEKGIDTRTSYFSGLATEEMAGNIIRYGFENENNIVELFLLAKDGHVTIHIRDNCRLFDAVSYLSQFENEDVTKNIGIRLASKITKEMKYQTIFGMNMLIMEF